MAPPSLIFQFSVVLIILYVPEPSGGMGLSKFNFRPHHHTKRAGEASMLKRFFTTDYIDSPTYHNIPAYYGGYDPNGQYMSAYYGGQADGEHGQQTLDCPAYKPFKCPDIGDENICISIQYLCDGAPDCPGGYDENQKLCTAMKRPPVDETESFLHSLLTSHGPNYLEKLFGQKARAQMTPMGGSKNVAIALSESQTIEDFAATMKLAPDDTRHLRHVFMAVENGDIGSLKAMGIKDSELGDVKFFLDRLITTGFLD